MRRCILALLLIFLLLLPQTVHADVLFLDPSGIANAFIQEKSVLLDAASNEFISLTELVGYLHPHIASEVCRHESGRLIRIRCLYTDEQGHVWALHKHVQEFGRDCWVPFDGLALASTSPLPDAPDVLPIPQHSLLSMILLAAVMILISCMITLLIFMRVKRKIPTA